MNKMNLKTLRQVLKALGDDTRLRIVNLLCREGLTVKGICDALGVSQTAVSKHLTRLRLLKIVIDRREGNFVRYRLNAKSDRGKIVEFLISEFGFADTFLKDIARLKRINRQPALAANQSKNKR